MRPAYPLWVIGSGKKPPMEHAMFKSIYSVPYNPYGWGRDSLSGVRLPEEMEELDTMDKLFEKGIATLENTGSDNVKLLKLANVVEKYAGLSLAENGKRRGSSWTRLSSSFERRAESPFGVKNVCETFYKE